jgi:hypothetical protein
MALQDFTYDEKILKRGDCFDAPELHGKLFIEAGRAKERRGNGLIGIPADLDNRSIKADDNLPQATDTSDNREKRRRYQRRDMRARE